MAQLKAEESVQKAATSEQYFTSLPTQTRIEMISVLVVEQIIADISGGRFLLRELKKLEENSHE